MREGILCSIILELSSLWPEGRGAKAPEPRGRGWLCGSPDGGSVQLQLCCRARCGLCAMYGIPEVIFDVAALTSR